MTRGTARPSSRNASVASAMSGAGTLSHADTRTGAAKTNISPPTTPKMPWAVTAAATIELTLSRSPLASASATNFVLALPSPRSKTAE